jgi:hypothetical protein
MQSYSLTHVSDHVLLRDLAALVAQDRLTTAELLAHIAEVDTRRLYVPAGCSSMYAYCVEELHLSEDAASKRIQAARAARRFPVVFSAVAEGRLHLTAVCLLAPYLTAENFGELIEAAAYRRKFEIEDLLARRFGPTSEPSVGLWALTAAQTGRLQHALAHVGSERGPDEAQHALAHVGSEPGPDGVQHALAHVESGGDRQALGNPPISGGDQHAPAHAEGTTSNQASPERYLLQVAIARGTREKLRHAQALLSHAVPGGDMAEVLDRALDALIVQLEARKFGAGTGRLRKASRRRRTTTRNRYVPADVRRAVWERDQGRCTFVSGSGKRCTARRFLEFDHVEPVARGGRATVEGIRLRCRAHNQYEAERVFGRGFMNRKRQMARVAAAEGRPQAQQAPAEEWPQAQQAPARAATREQARDVLSGLRNLGCRPDEARRAAEFSSTLEGATLEERMRAALRFLGRPSVQDRVRTDDRVRNEGSVRTAPSSPLSP